MPLVEAQTGLMRHRPPHEVVDADDLLLVARADGGAPGVAVHAALACNETYARSWRHVQINLLPESGRACRRCLGASPPRAAAPRAPSGLHADLSGWACSLGYLVG